MFLQSDSFIRKKVVFSRFKANFSKVTPGNCSFMLVKPLHTTASVVIKHSIIIRNFGSVRHSRTTCKTNKTYLLRESLVSEKLNQLLEIAKLNNLDQKPQAFITRDVLSGNLGEWQSLVEAQICHVVNDDPEPRWCLLCISRAGIIEMNIMPDSV